MADTNQPKPGSLWSRLFGMDMDDKQTETSAADVVPGVDADDAVPLDQADPTDPGATIKYPLSPKDFPESFLAIPAEPMPAFPVTHAAHIPLASPVESAIPQALPVEAVSPPPLATPVAAAALPPCPSCGEPRKVGLIFCDDCGYLFSNAPPSATAAPVAIAMLATHVAMPQTGDAPSIQPVASPVRISSLRIKDRYLLGQVISEKEGVTRYRGLDASTEPSTPVVIVRASQEAGEATMIVEEAIAVVDEFIPTFDVDVTDSPTADAVPVAMVEGIPTWPRPAWERDLLTSINHFALPEVIDFFLEENCEYLVLEDPQGTALWDAWDDPDTDATGRYGYLKQVAQGLDALHKNGAIIECLSPDHIIVDAQKNARIANVGDLLPLPLPLNVPIKANLYTAPELILSPQTADGRASLYSLGAVLYSLEYLHHGLEEKDFEKPYAPKQITDRFPDVHPLLPRLINKTFVREPGARFPSDEASRTDPTGIQELIQTLGVCQRVFDSVRLDMAAWTTTGMVRTGNEDAFAFLHGVDSRQDDLFEYALILLCDGMGGYEAGEIAAALCIAEMKKFFLQQPMFAGLTGKDTPQGPFDVEAAKKIFEAGLRHANREVFTASRTPGKGKRGMGCTAEAVYIDPHHIIVGHVGDSRAYHLCEGRLIQMTRDQTLVNRLVELGQITEAEAEDHPRKNELQQAIGGQPDVSPGVYHARIKRGDWVLVCSDGLSNHIGNKELEKMLTREASNSSEEAARRLLNLVNLRGATDNATIVVVRAS